jgi:hypothetical protein
MIDWRLLCRDVKCEMGQQDQQSAIYQASNHSCIQPNHKQDLEVSISVVTSHPKERFEHRAEHRAERRQGISQKAESI